MSNPKDNINLKNPWHFLATGFGSGLSPIIPGTMGTVASIPLYLLIVQLPFAVYILITIVAAVIGITICQKTSDDMGVHDHGSIVWDEFVGFWITMAIAPVVSWQWILAGFVLFRFFDMIKPWPISWLDKHVHGGFGIMVDDILAGFMAMICLWGVGHWFGW
ncbi:phosphatidylglycerophosphatase A [Photobacterium profundum]|uniref:Phosphatidylglycerophosphatase A n=1 Tax=Photobacterium profundum 3TCK TaxID=314280 RepID=Q1Z7N3_9GAMM|nr:phosphatidylglycerophosphatase A [Photobacterium profundum]EAS44426.1 Putative phosphatidylglycerophosphatase A [Photobacterium profundum 3TCK]PSV64703.1 phosphatidylglycerophosphatase A [Photobacterium profundum]